MSKEIKPVKFEEQNYTYVAEGCGDLPAWIDGEQIISCWKIPFIKRLKMIFTGRIWLGVMGVSQPPVWLAADKPFKKTKGE